MRESVCKRDMNMGMRVDYRGICERDTCMNMCIGYRGMCVRKIRTCVYTLITGA